MPPGPEGPARAHGDGLIMAPMGMIYILLVGTSVPRPYAISVPDLGVSNFRIDFVFVICCDGVCSVGAGAPRLQPSRAVALALGARAQWEDLHCSGRDFGHQNAYQNNLNLPIAIKLGTCCVLMPLVSLCFEI